MCVASIVQSNYSFTVFKNDFSAIHRKWKKRDLFTVQPVWIKITDTKFLETGTFLLSFTFLGGGGFIVVRKYINCTVTVVLRWE
jgi:hypothetical protein